MIRALGTVLVRPLTILWILLVLAGFFSIKRSKAIARAFIGCATAWLLAVSTPFFPNLLVRGLEDRYAPFAVESLRGSDLPVHILVLGGGHTSDERFPANDQLSSGALERLVEGVRIHRMIPGSLLITSGYAGQQGKAQALVLARTAELLGVDPADLRTIPTPRTTATEAADYKTAFGDKARLVLVTSAIHMPRAMMLFRRAGLGPVAAPTGHLVKRSPRLDPWFWLPSAENIGKTEAAMHEYGGLFWCKLGGS